MSTHSDIRSTDIRAWRLTILDEVASLMSAPEMPQTQRAMGFWKLCDRIPFPLRGDIQVLDVGSMTFSVNLDGHPVFFSAFIAVGEVRLGARIPMRAFSSSTLKDKISQCNDGNPCNRTEAVGDGILFDWVFRENFASFGVMLESINDPTRKAVIADRIFGILSHLYMAILSALLEAAPGAPTVSGTHSTGPRKRVQLRIVGDIRAFAAYAEQRSLILEETVEGEGGATIRANVPAAAILGIGYYGKFEIRDVAEIPAAAASCAVLTGSS